MKNSITNLENQLGIIYTKLTNKPWKNTAKQIEEFSKYQNTLEYIEAKCLIKKILIANF